MLFLFQIKEYHTFLVTIDVDITENTVLNSKMFRSFFNLKQV